MNKMIFVHLLLRVRGRVRTFIYLSSKLKLALTKLYATSLRAIAL